MKLFLALLLASAAGILFIQGRSPEMARQARRMLLVGLAVPFVTFAFGSAMWSIFGLVTGTWRPENWVMFSAAGLPVGAYASWSIGRKFRKP